MGNRIQVVAIFLAILLFACNKKKPLETSVFEAIRINQLGYLPHSIKVAVYGSNSSVELDEFSIFDAVNDSLVLSFDQIRSAGKYGPFRSSFRLDFSKLKTSGEYFIVANGAKSRKFRIASDVYDHSADFLLEYMRQQRCGFNPFLVDSCHLDDGYILYNPSKDGQRIDVTGGWHDATDYLQYTATSANAIYQLLFAYRENPSSFGDLYNAIGLPGPNGIPDIIDEAKWGMDWLKKMNPSPTEYYNQIADDRDHVGYRLPNKDSAVYNPNRIGRPVYLATGEKQGMLNYKNRSTGVASTAGKYASAFALGATVLEEFFPDYVTDLTKRSRDAYQFGQKHPGVSQTAPGSAPYFYEEENWVDDMELAASSLYGVTNMSNYKTDALDYAAKEKVTPWIGKDTVVHYQYYPFLNAGHYELASQLDQPEKQELALYYKEGLELLKTRGENNPFYIGIPFVWCSNNFVTAAVTQCKLYRELTGDNTFLEMEAALRDWLFGCNPWGASMIVGLPSDGDTPVAPHSSLTVIEGFPTNGGLVDGPVYGSIFNSLLGLELVEEDEYAQFQSDLVVYHDDFGDYSTNEPTMDGTASLVYYLSSMENESRKLGHQKKQLVYDNSGAIIRGDLAQKQLHLLFSADEFADGSDVILNVLDKYDISASFFLTGNFYRDPMNSGFIEKAKKKGHYLGAHSDNHLLYNAWSEEKELLVTQDEFKEDLMANFEAMERFGIRKEEAPYFLPPYEWNNEIITQWADQLQVQLINYTPGTITHADYTTPDMKNYRSSDQILESVTEFEKSKGLNGFMLLSHLGTDPKRKDKFYTKLDGLISYLISEGYQFSSLPDHLALKNNQQD